MNNNFKKAGILIGILVIPALVFIGLKLFGHNYYSLPYIFPKLDESGEIIFNGKDTVFHQIPKFELIDQNNQTFGSDNTKGKIYVADFFFTRCGTICPKLTTHLSRIQEAFEDNPNVLIVSHSIDPKHDSASILKAYSKKYGSKDGKWFFLTGEKKAIYDLAIKGYKLPVSDASEYDKNIKDIDQTFIHSEKLLLIDREGYIRGLYDGTLAIDVDRLQAEIKVLLEIYKTEKK